MTYDKKNYGGIQGYSQKIPRITSQQTQDNPGLEYRVNSTNELMKKTYYPNSEPVEGFAVEDSFSVSIEELGSVYNLHQLVIQFSMMLGSIGTSMPKFIQAVRVIHTRDKSGTSLDSLKVNDDNKKKKIAESTYTLCFFWDATAASMIKIPKNSLVQIYFIDNKREYGLIWNSSFATLGNFSGTPNPGFDKFNGTTLTNFGSPGAGGGMGGVASGTGAGTYGTCNPYTAPITPVDYIYCGTTENPDRQVKVHPSAPVCNYNSPGFAENGFVRFGSGRSYQAPKILVTHWDVCHHTKGMFDAIHSKGIEMGFGVDRNGMIFQFANAGQARFGAANFGEGTAQCEVNNPVLPDPAVKAYNRRCYNGDENGERRLVPTNNFKFPGGDSADTRYDSIYDFFDGQYFSVGALWEAISFAYGTKLALPDPSWIDWRPGSSGGAISQPHPFSNSTDPVTTREYIKKNYEGILFHHNIDARKDDRTGNMVSWKWDIVILNRQLFLTNALAIRAQRKPDGTF